jgi:hypothetical protein
VAKYRRRVGITFHALPEEPLERHAALPFEPGRSIPICSRRHSCSGKGIVVNHQNSHEMPVDKPVTRKLDPRNRKPDRFNMPENLQIADQNRKLLGKHYANKYRTGR